MKAGEEVDAWYTKCRLELLHRVVAVVAGTPKRVECKTCGSQHNFRAPKAAPSARKPAARKRTSPTTSSRSTVTDWERFVAGKPENSFMRYAPSQSFKAEQLIYHVKFGNGYVLEALPDGKINVLFRDGNRLLVHGR